MIKIFNAMDRDFSSAGNITINPTKCLETRKKSLNGWYLDVEVPIKYKNEISTNMLCVVKSKSKLNPQAFRIKNIEYTSRKIVFQAQHVMFDAADYFLLDVRPENKNGQNALLYVNERTDKTSPFSIYSNVMTISTAYFIRKSLLEAWITIEERWGGVFDADNWNISLYSSMGNDNGETIIYGQNLEHIRVYEDWSSVCTKICPVGYDGITLPEHYLESEIQYDEPYTRKVEFETDLDTETATEQQYIAELRTNAQKYLSENQYPKISYEVSANVNENLGMCDMVHVKHPLCDILTEVLEYTYNIVSEKTKTISFGNYTKDVKTKFDAIKSSFTQIQQKLSKQEQVIVHQTNLINRLNKNGIVYIDDNEILILDKLPKEQAENVWRFGLSGIGFSSNGYEGPFETAITMDGQINANFITTGVMSAARIEGLETSLTNIRIAIELNGNSITSIAEDVESQGNRLSRMVQTVEELNSKIQDIANITVSGESQLGQVSLINVDESEPVVIKVHPIGTNISYLYPRANLYPSPTLFMPNRIIRFKNTKTNKIFDWKLPANLLYYDENNFDDFLLDYESQSCIVNKKVGYNADGTTYVLSNPRTDSYSFPSIQLTAGNYEVSLPGYNHAYLYVNLMAANYYTAQFATIVKLNSELSQTVQSIMTRVSADYELKSDAISKYSELTQTALSIQTQVNNNNQEISTVKQTANSLDAEIKNARGSSLTLKNRIDGIASRVSTIEGNITELEQTTTSISATVSNNNTRANIVAKINDNTSSILIKADKVDLSGFVTVTGLSKGTTTINGSCITTGTIDATKVKVTNINANNITTGIIKSKNYEANVSGTAINLNTGVISTKNFKVFENGNVSINGNVTATSGNIGGCEIANGSLTIKNANIESINGNKITDNSVSNSKINSVAPNKFTSGTVSTDNFVIETSSGYIKCGSGVTHPYVSALNVAYGGGGLSFRNGITVSSVGSEIGKIFMDTSSGSNVMYQQASGGINLCNGTAKIIPGERIETNAIQVGNTNDHLWIGGHVINDSIGAQISMDYNLDLWSAQGYHVRANGSQIGGDNSTLNIKQNVKERDTSNILDILKQIKLYDYNYIPEFYNGKESYGYIIDYLEKIPGLNKYVNFVDVKRNPKYPTKVVESQEEWIKFLLACVIELNKLVRSV